MGSNNALAAASILTSTANQGTKRLKLAGGLNNSQSDFNPSSYSSKLHDYPTTGGSAFSHKEKFEDKINSLNLKNRGSRFEISYNSQSNRI